jgi:hypothetical protein
MAAQGVHAMTRVWSAIKRRTERWALELGEPPYVLMPGSTSFDSRGP